MSLLLTYSGLTTKVRAMSRNLITPEEYEQIASLHSVREVIGFLQNHPAYSKSFALVDTQNLHRADLEKILRVSEYQSFAKLYNFSSLKGRRYLEYYFIRYDVYFLKMMIRELMNSNSISLDIHSFIMYYERFSDINLRKLVLCTNVDEFIEALNGSRFYQVLKKVRSIDNTTLFDYELSLDLFMFTYMWDNCRKYLKGKDLEVFTQTYGTTIDMLNISWIFRSKKFYKLSTAQLYSVLLPVNYKLRKSHLKSLVEAESVQTMIDVLSTTVYGKYLKLIEGGSLESLYRVVLDRVHQLAGRNLPYTLATVNLYLYLKHKEIGQLITLTECIRYSYTPDEIRNMYK